MLLRAAKLHELLVTLHGADGLVRVQLAASNHRVRGAAIGAHRTDRPIPRRLAPAGGVRLVVRRGNRAEYQVLPAFLPLLLAPAGGADRAQDARPHVRLSSVPSVAGVGARWHDVARHGLQRYGPRLGPSDQLERVRIGSDGGRIGDFVATRISLPLLVSRVICARTAWAAVPSRHAVILPERTNHRPQFARVKHLAA